MANYSRQRELIRTNLLSRSDHPTADAVYNSIKEELPTISLGTVYRNLRLLADQGEIMSLDIGDGKEHFDGNTRQHYHFICNRCGAVQDIFMEPLNIDDIASEHLNGRISGHKIYFYGLCVKCMEQSFSS